MCDPVSITAAAAVGTQALGSIAQGYAQSASDKANAKMAANNAAIMKQNATFASQEGEQQAGIEGQKTRQQAGSLKANQGATGVEVNTGSNANVQAGQEELGSLDMMNIRARAARQAYGFNTEATGYENQSAIDRAAGHNAIASGYISGVTKAAGEAVLLNSAGAFSGGGSDGAWNNYLQSSALNGVQTPDGSMNYGTGGLY